MRKLFKSFVILATLLSMVCVPLMASAANPDGVNDIGTYTNPITGKIYKFVQAKTSDCIRLNEQVIYVITTEVKKDPATGKFAPMSEMVRADAASGYGIVHGFFQGGFAGLAQGAGVATGMALLRPSNTFNSAGQNNGQVQLQDSASTAVSTSAVIGNSYRNYFGNCRRD